MTETIKTPNIVLNEQYDVFEPTTGTDYVMIDWTMGTTCNYHCSYCDDFINNGKIPWPDYNTAIEFAKYCTEHYESLGKHIVWNLLGGEPTVWSRFSEFISELKTLDPSCVVVVLTNGSRTLSWWERNAKNFDNVIISYHSENADYKHCTEVANVLNDARVRVGIQVCMLPSNEQKCFDALDYFNKHSRANSLSAKALRVTLCSVETFKYSDEAHKYFQRFNGVLPSGNKNPAQFDLNHIKRMRFYNTKTKQEEKVNENTLMVQGRNSWKGWMCNIGLETLVVDTFGNVTSGSSCNPDINHGNISKPDAIEFPTKSVRCNYDWCSCISDIQVTKYKRP